jgi:hypothetical protein
MLIMLYMKLEDIIANNINVSVLERVVVDQNVLDKEQREKLFKSDLSLSDLACKVVEAYVARTSELAYGLYEQVSNHDWPTACMLDKHSKPAVNGYPTNHQANLMGCIPDLSLLKLTDFLISIKNQVCLIVSHTGGMEPKTTLGTGFLVGADLVLTCDHVLTQFAHDANLIQGGNSIEIYFDFHYGDKVQNINPNLPGARKVQLADKWYVTSSPWTNPDGLQQPRNKEDNERLQNKLDFILVRLAEKVGEQSVNFEGGRIRGWVDVANEPVTVNDWIIIPQHPEGSPQRIDLGRFKTLDFTNTRLRYNTNTANGTSGAPCFNHHFKLVGLHNGYVGPREKPILNQAIWITSITTQLTRYLNLTPPHSQAEVLRWCLEVRNNEPPQVILGRETLLQWLQASATPEPQTFSDRVYVAHTEAPAAGCSFSLDILQSITRNSNKPRAVYGQSGQQLPVTAEDFIYSLLRELGIILSEKENIPRRPKPLSADPSSTGIPEVDKLSRWISQELPDWLGEILDNHAKKKQDIRPLHQDIVNLYSRRGVPAPQESLDIAKSRDPVLVPVIAWDCAYIVIDDLRTMDYSCRKPRMELEGEVRDLIAALVRGKGEMAIHTGLRRLRWMFLGYLPDFIPNTGQDIATIEVLEPNRVGVDEVKSVFDRMSNTNFLDPAALKWQYVTVGLVMEMAANVHLDMKLASLQRATGLAASKYLKV